MIRKKCRIFILSKLSLKKKIVYLWISYSTFISRAIKFNVGINNTIILRLLWIKTMITALKRWYELQNSLRAIAAMSSGNIIKLFEITGGKLV